MKYERSGEKLNSKYATSKNSSTQFGVVEQKRLIQVLFQGYIRCAAAMCLLVCVDFAYIPLHTMRSIHFVYSTE